MAVYKHILLAVDFTRGSEQVVRKAREMAEHCGARLSLTHAVEYIPMDLGSDLVLPQEVELDRELTDLATSRLEELGERLGVAESDRHILQGSTRSEILRLATEIEADLIVIGSHGRHGIQLLLGSTANAVLHGAPCDVLAVRIREE